jgi:ABC transport system ATP-binding/permease protein
MNFLRAEHLTKAYGDKLLFEDIAFSLNQYEKVALIARNGAGKSTLLRIIMGQDIADAGDLYIRDDISIGFLPQEPVVKEGHTVLDAVLDSEGEAVHTVKNYRTALASGDAKAVETASAAMDDKACWNYEQEIQIVLDKLKIFDLNRKASTMSGGEKKRIALAKVLLKKPDLMILDEPTNHLDFRMIEWLEDYIADLKITLLVVTHDRFFLNRVCNVIWEIDEGDMYEYKGDYKDFLIKREERIELFLKQSRDLSRELKKEEEWAKTQPKARGTKAKYRIENYKRLKELAARKRNNSKLSINIKTKRLGKKIADVYSISKSFDGNPIVEDFSYKFSRFQKAAIVGDNGTGKSTLLNMLTGILPPDSGTVDIGETVVFGYYRQDGLSFSDDSKVIDVITDIAETIQTSDGNYLTAAAFLEHFLFPRHTHFRFVHTLSGGEKKRLYLLSVLMKNPNFLILDEPTNDLDIMTLEVLEEYLKVFAGNLLVVSHDRYFTDEVADTLFVLDGTPQIKQFPGKYSDYLKEIKTKEAKEKEEASALKLPKKNTPSASNKQKLSYKEKTEFEELEHELEKLNAEKAEIEQMLSEATVDAEEITKKSKRLSELNEMIDTKEFRWLELSEKA